MVAIPIRDGAGLERDQPFHALDTLDRRPYPADFPSTFVVRDYPFAGTTLFTFVTLPVEFDASRRALVWLDRSNITHSQQHTMAKDALHWAAMTYVIAALSSLATLLYYVSIFMNRRD